MAHWTMLGVAAMGALATTPAAAQTLSSSEEANVRALLAEARQARDDAAEAQRNADEARRKSDEARRKAEDAIALLEGKLQGSQPRPPVLASTNTVQSADDRPTDMPACDAVGANSIGSYMLDMGDAGIQKKEASRDPKEEGSDRGINAFVYHCLGLKKAEDYETVTNLSAQFSGTKGSDEAEIALTRVARALREASIYEPDAKDADKEGNVRALAATYNRYRLGGFGRTGSNGEATLIDLTKSNFASGVGVVAGFEWGRMRPVAESALRKSIHDGIAKARQECVAAKSIDDPLNKEDAITGDRPRLALDPLSKCQGDDLVVWMKERGNQYWSDIVAPIWGYKKDPETFAGIEARLAFQDVNYRPIKDPATDTVIATTLPDEVTIHPEPYSVKLYGGFNRALGKEDDPTATIGMTGSLTYRREVEFIAGTSGETFCIPATTGATYDLCSTNQNLAAPYDTEGFVGGLALDFQLNRLWYLPPIATSPRITYAFDTKRFGIEVPLFLQTDSEGKVNSGVKYTCRFRGQTPEGFELRKSCSINLFVGTSFQIGKAP